MVLAAGLGTRIRALAPDRPKPLVEVAGRALIDYALDEVARGGASRAVVNVHYLADQVEAHLQGRDEPRIVLSDERAQLMETGGGLIQASGLLGDGPVFCTNTDAILEGEGAARLAAAWDDAAMDALLLLVPTANTSGYAGKGDFALGTDGRLSWEGGDKLVFTGLQIIHPRLWAGRTPAPQSTHVFWDEAMANGRLFGLVHDGFWMHVGDPAGHAAAEARLTGN
nr:nucleotidyltransferase family protein [Parvularcula dongshanensis]